MGRKSNLVSVIIPCFNHGEFIHEAIECILNQTYQNFEIIVVDDGSDESNTIEILEKLNYPKTTVYRKKNGGPASARNYGIKKSKGQYILTLDADDKFAPTFLEKGLDVLASQPQTGMVTSYVKRFGNDEVSTNRFSGGNLTDFLVKNNAVACLLFRFECWKDAGGYDEDIPGFEDWEFAISVTKNEWVVYSIPEYLFYYRNKKDSQYNRDTNKRPEIVKYLTQKHEDVFRDNLQKVIYAKELEIQNQMKKVSVYKNSYAQKIGNAVIKPLKVIKNLFLIT